jgi:hypothetical protein
MSSMARPQCTATTNSGDQCTRPAEDGSMRCWQHKETPVLSVQEAARHPLQDDVQAESGMSGLSGLTGLSNASNVDVKVASLKAKLEQVQAEKAVLVAKERLLKKQIQALTDTNHIARKAKSLFYHANKGDAGLLGQLQPALQKAGLLIVRNGRAIIPWIYVREVTDRRFMELNVAERQVWMERAIEVRAQESTD